MIPLAVLNPAGADPDQDFSGGPGDPSDRGHPPINYHAYAACCGGVFVRAVPSIPVRCPAVLVLLRPRHLARAARAAKEARAMGLRVFVSWKESGLAQVCAALSSAGRWQEFRNIARVADGFLSSTGDLAPVYAGAGFARGGFVPTPYPLEFPAWDFSRPDGEGVFVGTREFDVPVRAHAAALAALAPLAAAGTRVTAVVTGGRADAALARMICPGISLVPGPLPYGEYLRLMASHAVVFQADRSSVPGQVAGDALLAGVPCIGGDGAIDRFAFGECGPLDASIEHVRRFLADAAARREFFAESRERAMGVLSFGAGARRIAEIFG